MWDGRLNTHTHIHSRMPGSSHIWGISRPEQETKEVRHSFCDIIVYNFPLPDTTKHSYLMLKSCDGGNFRGIVLYYRGWWRKRDSRQCVSEFGAYSNVQLSTLQNAYSDYHANPKILTSPFRLSSCHSLFGTWVCAIGTVKRVTKCGHLWIGSFNVLNVLVRYLSLLFIF